MARITLLASIVGMALTIPATPLAQALVPGEFRGDWVPRTANCQTSSARLRVGSDALTLVSGSDMQTWRNVGVPPTFFGPDYTGISVVVLPDFDQSQPFMVYFNADEKKGVARVEIYREMAGPMNAQVAAIQAAAKRLAERFPLNGIPLKKC